MIREIKIAIQDSHIPDSYATLLIDACESLGLEYECFGMIPFLEDISAITGNILEDTDSLIIPFGSTKIIKLWLKGVLPQNWKIFYNEKGFNSYWQSFQKLNGGKYLDEYLLNAGCWFTQFPECADDYYTEQDAFVRPAGDLKLFNGQIRPAGTSLRQLLSEQNTSSDIYDKTELIMVADIKHIISEYRCFVVGDKVSTCLYRQDGQLVNKETNISEKFELMKLCTLWNPSDNTDNPFVVDVALINSNNKLDWKILEYNCFHCSGFYGINVEYTLQCLVEYVGRNFYV